MSLPSYRELTIMDKNRLREANILNGCGPQSWKGKGPNWLFEACCFWHDYNYARGGDELARLDADIGFYDAMKRDVKRHSWWIRWYLYARAWAFYQLVRTTGAKHFNSKQPTTLDEMIEQNK